MKKIFSTFDLYLSSFCSLNNIEPKLENRDGKIVFVFTTGDDLYRLLDRFNSNESVPVNDFVTKIKILRGKMLTAKEGNGYERRERSYNR
jgi:hypothetical protein